MYVPVQEIWRVGISPGIGWRGNIHPTAYESFPQPYKKWRNVDGGQKTPFGLSRNLMSASGKRDRDRPRLCGNRIVHAIGEIR